MKLSQKGFSVVEVLIVIVVFGALVGVGYFAYNRINNKDETQSAAVIEASSEADVVEINSAEDLDKATGSLDELESSMSDAELEQLDETLNTF